LGTPNGASKVLRYAKASRFDDENQTLRPNAVWVHWVRLKPWVCFHQGFTSFWWLFSHPVEKYHRQIGRNLPQIEMKIKIFETTT